MADLIIDIRRFYNSSFRFRWSCRFLITLILVSLFSPFLASENPLIIKTNNSIYFPLGELKRNVDLKSENIQWQLNAPVKYSPGISDFLNADFKSPFDIQYRIVLGNQVKLGWYEKHILGTDLRGCDLLSGLIHGTSISLMIGIGAAIISFLIGVILGGLAGLYSVNGYKINLLLFVVIILDIIFLFNLLFNVEVTFVFKFIIIFVLILLHFLLSNFVLKWKYFNIQIKLYIDEFERVLNLIFSSFPKTMLIIIVSAFLQPSWFNVILLLGFTGWMEIARLTRAEFIRISTHNYFDAAKLTGATFYRIIVYHLLPNALPSILTVMIFFIGTNILIESSLSFLGIGIPSNAVTWGSLLASSKDNFGAWWLIFFPGLILTLTINSLMIISEKLQKTRAEY